MASPSVVVQGRVGRGSFAVDVDLRANVGDIVGITGDIGTGKSTILAVLADHHAPASTIEAAATVVAPAAVGMLSQQFQTDLVENLSGTENLVNARPDVTDQASARALLAALGVQDHVVDRLPWTFSGAESQRVALARALFVVADRQDSLLLLDEPVGALDKRTRAIVIEFLARWLDEFGGVAIIASADPDLLARLGAKLVRL